jgi:glucose-1-phosphate cytidylyltransferase
LPKPMIPIGGKPIIWHIMTHYARYGHQDFYAALGYKADVIKDFFLNYRALSADFTINLGSGAISSFQFDPVDWNVTLVNTGLKSMTGGRVKRLRRYIGDETFMLTYGDGVADVNLDQLLEFHESHGRMATITAVRPAARFGELSIENHLVRDFQEKPQLHDGWVNGGFFVLNPEFFDLIDGDDTLLEREPLERAAKAGELMAFRHDGFWQCMDTKRDMESLERAYQDGKGIWKRV